MPRRVERVDDRNVRVVEEVIVHRHIAALVEEKSNLERYLAERAAETLKLEANLADVIRLIEEAKDLGVEPEKDRVIGEINA